MPRVYFFAGPEDTRSLASFFLEKKMTLVSTRFDDARDVQIDSFVEQPGCFVSPVPLSEIKRNEFQLSAKQALRRDHIDPCLQPVIMWRRSAIDLPYLLAGDLDWMEWTDGSLVFPSDPRLRQLHELAGKTFRSARRWISKHWTYDGSFWFGPEAIKLRDSGLKISSFHPEKVNFSTVIFDDTGARTVVRQSSEEFFDTKRK